MGIFDFLFGSTDQSRCEEVPDKIWLTEQAKFQGIATEVAERAKAGAACILLVAHFEDVRQTLEAVAAGSWAVPVQAVLANRLTPDLAYGLGLDETSTIDLLVAERHPLPSEDDRLVEFARQLPCRVRVEHYLSLQDPVFSSFSGEWVHNMLANLGMKEDECIESHMVARRLRGAQEKIAKQAVSNHPADSADEWLERNLPD